MRSLAGALKSNFCNTFPDTDRVQSHGKGAFWAAAGQKSNGEEREHMIHAFKKNFWFSTPRAIFFRDPSATPASYGGGLSRRESRPG